MAGSQLEPGRKIAIAPAALPRSHETQALLHGRPDIVSDVVPVALPECSHVPQVGLLFDIEKGVVSLLKRWGFSRHYSAVPLFT